MWRWNLQAKSLAVKVPGAKILYTEIFCRELTGYDIKTLDLYNYKQIRIIQGFQKH